MRQLLYIFVILLSGCIVVPKSDKDYVSTCEISSDKKRFG